MAFMTLVESKYSAECEIFLNEIMKLAQIDVFGGEQINSYFFSFSFNKPFSTHFENYQYEDMNFVNTSGSIFLPVFMTMILYHMLAKMLHRMTIHFYTVKCCRRMGPKI